jgi:hypothetical protein
MPLMKVLSNMLSFQGEKHKEASQFPKGSILDCTDAEAKGLVRDGNAELAPAGSKVSLGVPISIDPVERDLREKRFEELQKSGVMKKPEGADSIRTPIPGTSEGIGMAHRAATVDAQSIK